MLTDFYRFAKATCISLGLFTLLSCSGGDEGGETTVKPVDTAKNTMSVNARAVGGSATCPNGGIEVDLGVDDNGNGTLETTEIDETKLVCNGEDGVDGLSALVDVTQLASHENCEFAAVQIDVGVDSNNNQLLDSNEITGSSFVCSNQSTGTNATLSGKGVIRGQVPANLLASQNRFLPQTRSGGVGSTKRPVTSQSGSLWISSSDVVSAIVADQEATEQAEQETEEGEVEAPEVVGIEVTVDENGNYEAEVPAGTDYEVTLISSDASEGVQIDDVSVSPDEATEVAITVNDLTATGTALLTAQNFATGQVLTNANVQLLSGGFDLTTDENGQVLLEGLAAGNYRVLVQAEGFVSKNVGFAVTSGQQTDIGVIELNNQKGNAVGRIEAEGLSSLINLVVYARGVDGSIYTTLTDRNGHYQFTGLPVGEGYSFIAQANDFKANKQDNVSIVQGETSSIGTINLTRKAIVDGVVTGSITGYAKFQEFEGQQNKHAGIIVSVEGTDKEGITSRDGAFIINGLLPGDYTLNYTDSNHETVTLTNVQVRKTTTTNLDPQFLAGLTGSVSGQIIGANELPIANAIITEKSTGTNTVSGSDGRFILTNLIVGERFLEISKEGSEPTQLSVTVKKDSVKELPQPIQLVGHKMSGTVYLGDDEIDHSGVSVLIVGSDIPIGLTDQDGHFSLYGMAKGTYKLLFTKSGFQSLSININKIENDFVIDGIIQLEKNAGSVSGRVDIPADFGSTENVRIELLDLNGNVVSELNLDPSGLFLLTNVAPGENYILKLYGTDTLGNLVNSQVESEIIVSPGQLTELESSLTLNLVDPNPPVISNIIYDNNIMKNSAEQLLVNPTIYKYDANLSKVLATESLINFEVIASDADNDLITYSYEVTGGEILNQGGSQLRWRAPETGQNVDIIFVATSNNRTVKQVIGVKVNHKPEIRLTSHNESQVQDDDNILTFSSIDVVTFSAVVTDQEEGDITGDQILWWSDIQGVIGRGGAITASLKPGKHTLKITAEDSQGLTSESDLFFVKVNTPEQFLLKAPNSDVDYYNEPLFVSRNLNIQTEDLTLIYSSSDDTKVTVSELGEISAVSTGTSVITVQSTEKDDKNEPLYYTEIVSRVLGEADPTIQNTLGVNEIYQVRINEDTYLQTFKMPTLKKGHYSLILFDQANIVESSKVYSEITFGGASVTSPSWGNNRIHNFEVVAADSDYELKLWVSNNSAHDTTVKVGLFPGIDVRDTNGYLGQTYWDKNLEPNDSSYLAAPLSLTNRIEEYLGQDDGYDFYSLDVVEGETYTLEVVNDLNSSSNLSIKVGNYTDDDLYIGEYLSKDSSGIYEFQAIKSGKIIIQLTALYSANIGSFFKYTLAVYPSKQAGLKQAPNSYEFNNSGSTAYPIDLGAVIDSELAGSNFDPVDFYSLPVIDGETYVFEFANDAISAGGISLQIGTDDNIDSLFSQIIERNSSSSFELEATLSGTLLIKISRQYSNYKSRVFKYTLKTKPTLANGLVQDNESFEFNNTQNTAYPIALENLIEAQLDGSLFDRFDYYRFPVEQGQTYSVLIANEAVSAGQLSLEVGTIEDTTQYIDEYQDVNTSGVYTFVPTASHDVIVRLRSESIYNTYQYFKYKLAMYSSNENGHIHDEAAMEFNDSAATAYPIKLNQKFSAEISNDLVDVIDYYSFEAVKGEVYSLEIINNALSAGTLSIKVGTLLGESTYVDSVVNKGESFTQEITATQDGLIVIRLRAYTHGTISFTGYYQYDMQVVTSVAYGLEQDSSTFEFNNTQTTAYPLDLDQKIDSELKPKQFDGVDYFSFDVEAGNTYLINTANYQASDSTLTVTISSSDGTSYATENLSKGDTTISQFTVLTTGKVIIKLTGSYSYNYLGYSLTAQLAE